MARAAYVYYEVLPILRLRDVRRERELGEQEHRARAVRLLRSGSWDVFSSARPVLPVSAFCFCRRWPRRASFRVRLGDCELVELLLH